MAVTTPPGRHYTPWCVKCNIARVLRIISIKLNGKAPTLVEPQHLTRLIVKVGGYQ